MSIDDGEGGILTNDADAELADSDDDAAANLSDIDDNNQAVDTYDDAESADFDTQQKAEALALHVMQTANASGHLAAIDAFDQANPSPWADLAAAQAAALAAQQTSQADAQLTQSNAQADAQETAEQARADALSSEDDSDAQAEDTQETTDAQSEHDQAVAQATMADGVSDDLPDTLVAPADGPDQTLTADFVRGGYEANDFWVGGNPGLFWEFAQSFIPELGAPAFMPSDLAFVPLMYLPVGSGDGQMPYGLLGPDPRTYGPADGTFYGESSVVTAPGVVYGNPVPYPLYGLARDGFFPDSGVYGPAMHFRGPSADLLDLSKAPSAVGSGGYSSSPLPTTTAGTQLPNPSATSSAATPMSLSAPTQSGTGQFAGIQSAAAEESGSGGETAPQTPAEAPATEEPAANEESDATNDSGDWTLGVWFLEESPDPAKKPTDAENRAAGEPEKSTGQTQQQLSEADKEAETPIYGPPAAAPKPADGNGSAEGASAQVGASSNEGDEASPADSQTVEALAIIIRVPVSQPPLRLGPDPNSPFALPLTDSELRGISLINHALAMPVGHRLEPLAPAPARQFPDINEGPQLTAREEQIKTNFLHAKWRGDTGEMTLWAEVWYREHNVPGFMAGPEFWASERREKFAGALNSTVEATGVAIVTAVNPPAGLALMGTMFVVGTAASAGSRIADGQTIGQVAAGVPLDMSGVNGIYILDQGKDIVTGKRVESAFERGAAGMGGVIQLAGLVVGGGAYARRVFSTGSGSLVIEVGAVRAIDHPIVSDTFPLVNDSGIDLNTEVYGPFVRGLSESDIAIVVKTGELKGTPARHMFRSDIPAVKAFRGHLPDGAVGVEFFTLEKPTTGPMHGFGGEQWRWYGNPGADTRTITIIIIKITQ